MAATALIACLLAGCGSDSSSTSSAAPARSATMILDFTPNAVHAGVYSALARHYDRHHGVRLHVIAPTASTDSIKLLETGRVDFAILDIHDLAIARQHGQDIVGVMAIVERPLSAVIAAPSVSSPRALPGKTVGITGVPSDTAVLRSIVAGGGGDPARLKTITIGFNAVADLLAGRVAAATAFWNDEGQAIQSKRPGFHIFRVENYGAPAYPELVLTAHAAHSPARPGPHARRGGCAARGLPVHPAAPVGQRQRPRAAQPGAGPEARLGPVAGSFADLPGRRRPCG